MDMQIIKPGIKTTEFWLTVITALASFAGGISGVLEPQLAASLSTFSTAIYTITRMVAKK